tara:strand:- start:49 stop:1605 length:1557 start_codon:yes stop_codon:yes gene_type:complete
MGEAIRVSDQHRRDDSGRDRLFRNVMAGWWAHGVTVVVGFLLPRIIYESVGQAALGVWDIGWSLVTYIAYSGLGISSAVTHYVARFRAEGDTSGVRATTAAASYCQAVIATAVAALFMMLFASLHLWLPGLDGFSLATLSRVGVLLGLAIVVGLLGAVAQGVLAGCHRGSWNEYLTIASDVALAAAMVAVLLAGWGILGLAAATLGVRAVSESIRIVLAVRACEGLSVRLADASWPWVQRIFTYGTKTSAGILQELLIHQFARLALALSAGPADVASYSRYATVIRQIGRSVERVTQVIPPMTSGLVGLGREGDVAGFSLRASNAAVMMMLPMILVFGALGDQLVAAWMGPEFVIPGLSWVFAAMATLHADRGVTTQILSGLNSHGRISLICLVTSLVLLLGLGVALFPLDPLTTGVLVAVSTVGGVTVPHFLIASRRLGIRPLVHFREVALKPLICNAIFLAFLLGAEVFLSRGAYAVAALTAITGGIVLAILYWFVAFDERLRSLVRHRLGALGSG